MQTTATLLSSPLSTSFGSTGRFSDDGGGVSGEGGATKPSGDPRLEHLPRMVECVRTLLECLGEDVEREGLQKTPARMSKALLALTAGYGQTATGVVGDALFESSSTDMVLVRDIECFSMCEHHMLPFFGRLHIAYMPAGKVLGLSKLARIADVFSKRLQIQERLTEQVAKAVEEACGAKGVAVMVDCQ